MSVIEDLAELLRPKQPTEYVGDHSVAVHKDYSMCELSEVDMDRIASEPSRVRSSVVLTSAKSFTDYVEAFHTPGTALFIDGSENCVTAVLDYHDGPGNPSKCTHTAGFAPKLSEQWQRWAIANDGRSMRQKDFGRFIHENRQDIVNPAAADVLELTRNLAMKKQVLYETGIELKTGQQVLEYREQVEQAVGLKGELSVPDIIQISIPVFEGMASRTIDLYLRLRVDDNQRLHIFYEMHRKDYVLWDAFDFLLSDMREKLKDKALILEGAWDPQSTLRVPEPSHINE